MDKRQALATEPVGALILKFSIPSVAGMLVNGLYSVVDRIFVGQGVGPEALAGVAITFPLTMLVMSFGMLVGHGAAAIISIRLGEGNREAAADTVGTAATLAFAFGLVAAVSVALFASPILRFFGGSGVTLDYALTFTRFYVPGILLQVMSFSLNNMIRGQGDPVTALVTMLFSAGVNCALNPLFIVGLHWGIAGSAIATDISVLCSLVWLLVVYRTTKTGIRLALSRMRPKLAVARHFLAIGIAPFTMQVAGVASIIIANHQVMRTGGARGMAVLGVSSAIVNLLLMPVVGVNNGIQPIVGYNFGAKQFDRVKKTVRLSMTGICLVSLAAYLLFALCAPSVMRLFVGNNPDLIALGAQSLRLFLVSMPLAGIVILTSGFFQSTGRPLFALVLNLLRQVVFLVPLYLILPGLFGLTGVWAAVPIADTVTAVLALFLVVPALRKISSSRAVGT